MGFFSLTVINFYLHGHCFTKPMSSADTKAAVTSQSHYRLAKHKPQIKTALGIDIKSRKQRDTELRVSHTMSHKVTPLPTGPPKSRTAALQPGTHLPLTFHKIGICSPAGWEGDTSKEQILGTGTLQPRVTKHRPGEGWCLWVPSQKTGINGITTSIAVIGDLVVV